MMAQPLQNLNRIHGMVLLECNGASERQGVIAEKKVHTAEGWRISCREIVPLRPDIPLNQEMVSEAIYMLQDGIIYFRAAYQDPHWAPVKP